MCEKPLFTLQPHRESVGPPSFPLLICRTIKRSKLDDWFDDLILVSAERQLVSVAGSLTVPFFMSAMAFSKSATG